MSKEAMKLALEALENHAPLTGKNAITALREALVEQPAKQDIPDLIAGTLGVSRGTAYDLMREALKAAAPVQEPVAEVVEDDFSKQVVGIGRWLKLQNGTKLYTAPPAAPVQDEER